VEEKTGKCISAWGGGNGRDIQKHRASKQGVEERGRGVTAREGGGIKTVSPVRGRTREQPSIAGGGAGGTQGKESEVREKGEASAERTVGFLGRRTYPRRLHGLLKWGNFGFRRNLPHGRPEGTEGTT